MHVRASSRRVQPHSTGINTNANNNQQATLSRRDISLLKQNMFNSDQVGSPKTSPMWKTDENKLVETNIFLTLIVLNIS